MSGRSALGLMLLVGCGGAQHPSSISGGPALGYEVALDPALETMTVTMCPRGTPLPDAIVPVHDEAAAHVHDPVLVEGGTVVRALATTSQRIELGARSPHACVRYAIDLASCTSPHGPTSCSRIGRDVFAPTSVWLFAPAVRSVAARYDLHFALPDGVHVTPISEGGATDPTHVVLDDRNFQFVTYLALVHAPPVTVPVPGACIDVATLDVPTTTPPEARARWLSAATAASARVTGEPPFGRMTALVVPGPDTPDMPVLFGVAGRGMRPTVSMLVGAHATEEALVPDWTAVHELAHLLTAYVDGEDAWLSEGLATYYQEVLRARQGLITEQTAWARLADGFARGRAESTGGTLRAACAGMSVDRSFTRVYWHGAALVLLADVAYRRAGSSLDAAIARAWPHRTERTTGTQLMAWLDGEEHGTFATIAGASIDTEGFPDPSAALSWLGVEVAADGTIALHDDAPGAGARRSLMNGDGPAASNPASCE